MSVSHLPVRVGKVELACPVCGCEVPVDVNCHIEKDDEGVQRFVCEPDMSDVWAHSFEHEGKAA